jgi:hypothetical protein
MASDNEKQEIKDYAEGWIQEREGTDAPPFLKAAFVVIGLSCTAYLFLFMNGEIDHSDRGPLVRAFNAISSSADGLMTMVGFMMLIYVAIVAVFAFRKMH